MSRFRPISRETDYLPSPSVHDRLPVLHLACYVVDAIKGLDPLELEPAYAKHFSHAYHPALSLLIYGYATGTQSSYNIKRAIPEFLSFLFIACDQHPDHDISDRFRRRASEQFAGIFVQVLQIVLENQLSRIGTESLDSTKIQANASRKSALSYKKARKNSPHEEYLTVTAAAKTNIEERVAYRFLTDAGYSIISARIMSRPAMALRLSRYSRWGARYTHRIGVLALRSQPSH